MSAKPGSVVSRLGVANFSKLIERRFDKESLDQLTEADWADLNTMSSREVMDEILTWEGIQGFTDWICQLHDQCFTPTCKCPECGSNDIRKGDLNDIGSTIDVPSVCRNCGEELRLVFDLTRIDKEN